MSGLHPSPIRFVRVGAYGGPGFHAITVTREGGIIVAQYPAGVEKPDGYATRYWGIYIDGELLAVVLYRKGAVAIADLIESTRSGGLSLLPPG